MLQLPLLRTASLPLALESFMTNCVTTPVRLMAPLPSATETPQHSQNTWTRPGEAETAMLTANVENGTQPWGRTGHFDTWGKHRSWGYHHHMWTLRYFQVGGYEQNACCCVLRFMDITWHNHIEMVALEWKPSFGDALIASIWWMKPWSQAGICFTPSTALRGKLTKEAIFRMTATLCAIVPL